MDERDKKQTLLLGLALLTLGLTKCIVRLMKRRKKDLIVTFEWRREGKPSPSWRRMMQMLIAEGKKEVNTTEIVTKEAKIQEMPQGALKIESNIVKAGSSFMVSGSNFKPGEKVWVDLEFQGSDWLGGVTANCEADKEGSIHPMIPIPEDIVPDDYEVSIYIGKDFNSRQLLATLPIHIQARR